jgi:hypothetical protein
VEYNKQKLHRKKYFPGVGGDRPGSAGAAAAAEPGDAGHVRQDCQHGQQRNCHLQTVLIEAAKLAPRYDRELARLHATELEKGNRNRATLAVARKLVAWLPAVDRQQEGFRKETETDRAALPLICSKSFTGPSPLTKPYHGCPQATRRARLVPVDARPGRD